MTKTFKDVEALCPYAKDYEGKVGISCGNMELTSLEGSPTKVNGDFYCGENPLKNFIGGPKVVTGSFDTSLCDELLSVAGVPIKMDKFILYSSPKLETIEQLRDSQVNEVNMSSLVSLKSLKGLPSRLQYLRVSSCWVDNLNDINCQINGNANLNANKITSLINIHKSFPVIKGQLSLYSNPIQDGWLYLLLVKGLQNVNIDDNFIQDIINKYLPMGKAGLIKAQMEMIANGYDEQARI